MFKRQAKTMKDANEMDLFGGTDAAGGLRGDVRLDVAKLDYLASESMTWRELFGGFDRMRAITYSSGIGFVYQLIEMFKDVEVIVRVRGGDVVQPSGDHGVSIKSYGAHP